MAKRLGEKDIRLIVIGVAVLSAGLLYALRQRGPLRGGGRGGSAVAIVCERVDAPLRQWRAIVLHHSGTLGGSAAAFDKTHRLIRGWNSLGYHFVIGNGRGAGDGEIEVGPRWRAQQEGAHARGLNSSAIGICLVGNFMKHPPTARQMASLKSLTIYLQERFSIPAKHVYLHSEVSGASTLCPGKRFPTKVFRSSLWTRPAEERR